MTALHTRIPNYEHQAHVLAIRMEMCAKDPLALDRVKRRAKAYPRYMRIKRTSDALRKAVGL